MASSAADAAAPPSAADGVAYGHASATQCYPAGAGEAVHASRLYASMDGAPQSAYMEAAPGGMQMMGLAPDQLPHALAGHPYVYALPPGMMMVPMQPQDADGHHAEAGMGGGPVRREGMRPNASRRTNYTVDFKRKVVRDALTRPLGNRIRPTCALYPHVEPCQLRKWIRALEAEVRAESALPPPPMPPPPPLPVSSGGAPPAAAPPAAAPPRSVPCSAPLATAASAAALGPLCGALPHAVQQLSHESVTERVARVHAETIAWDGLANMRASGSFEPPPPPVAPPGLPHQMPPPPTQLAVSRAMGAPGGQQMQRPPLPGCYRPESAFTPVLRPRVVEEMGDDDEDADPRAIAVTRLAVVPRRLRVRAQAAAAAARAAGEARGDAAKQEAAAAAELKATAAAFAPVPPPLPAEGAAVAVATAAAAAVVALQAAPVAVVAA